MNSDNASHLRHELRTPINHLIGYAELLLEDEDTSGPLVTLLGEVRELARQVLTVTAGVLDADASVSTVAVEALHGLVGELEECVAPLPAASGPGQAGDVERIVAATKRLREMVDSLQIPPGGDGPGGAAGGSTTALVPGPDGAAGDDGTATILVVDDDEANREVLARRLVRLGYRTVEARNGVEALEILASAPIDLVLLDVMMPEMDGYAVLERRRHDPALRDIPVIMISALDQVESIVRCIEQGAEDYLPKPFDPVLLQARVGACLEKKRLHDREKELLTTVTRQAEQLQAWNQQLEARVAEKVREVERLNELRRFVAPQLADVILSQGDELLRSHRREITVVFCDLRGFTAFAETGEPEDVMAVLDEYHGQLGPLVFEYGGTLEQFAGDGMMVFFNDPVPCEDPAWRAVQMAVAMRERARQLGVGWRRRGHQLDFGVGIAVGYATCGRIGFEGRFDYAAIGTVTNLAARLCAEAKGGEVLVSQRIYTMLEDQVAAESVGELELKGIARPVPAYNVTGLRAGA
jgi:class 3 adenylate cyclase/CheY-like chemotaxis protein